MNAYQPKHIADVDAVPPGVGCFPKQHNTELAEVLARLIDGEVMTGMSAVFDSSTIRLAAAIHDLRTSYSWVIESVKQAVPTNEGRITEICAYRLRRPNLPHWRYACGALCRASGSNGGA